MNDLKKGYVAISAIFILLIAATLFLGKPAAPDAPNESGLLPEITTYTRQNGIPYQNDSNPYHLLDAYLPDGDGPFPAIIYVHGGGWVQGNRSDFSQLAELYAKCGIAGFSVDYTLSSANDTAWPQDLNDVIAAIEYVQENAAMYNVDPEKIALMGSSAGAHLISLVGTLSGCESFLSTQTLEPIKSQIRLVINYDGVTDLEYIGENLNPSLIYNIVTGAFKATYTMNSTLWKEASPATYVSSDDSPFVFVHGLKDVIVPIPVAESFNNRLQSVGVETHFIRVDGDHDVLTSQESNLQARYQLDPLLAKAFNLKLDA
ncbi:MAG: alpha/beta hydrolase fold domain-containing protein [Candidatus Bathyarchaeia archaeon]|jgi:acetyl esterase/lipase